MWQKLTIPWQLLRSNSADTLLFVIVDLIPTHAHTNIHAHKHMHTY